MAGGWPTGTRTHTLVHGGVAEAQCAPMQGWQWRRLGAHTWPAHPECVARGDTQGQGSGRVTGRQGGHQGTWGQRREGRMAVPQTE